MPNPDEVAAELEKENIFLIPLAKGIRTSVASVPEDKCKLIPARIKAAMERLAEK
jgi:aromatic-amino-acid transaminase